MSEEREAIQFDPFEDPVIREIFPGGRARAAFEERMDFAETALLIRRMRDLGEISCEELAHRIGVETQYIEALERVDGHDAPSFHLLKRIARACGLVWPIPRIAD